MTFWNAPRRAKARCGAFVYAKMWFTICVFNANEKITSKGFFAPYLNGNCDLVRTMRMAIADKIYIVLSLYNTCKKFYLRGLFRAIFQRKQRVCNNKITSNDSCRWNFALFRSYVIKQERSLFARIFSSYFNENGGYA